MKTTNWHLCIPERFRNEPRWLAVLAFALFFARWAFVGSARDLGLEFESAYRASLNEVYGRDFYTAVAPLSSFILGTVFRNLGAYWFWQYVLYAACWIASFAGIAFSLGLVVRRRETLAFVLLSVIPLTLPHLIPVYLYNFLSSALVIWVAYFCIRFTTSGKWLHAAIAGVLAGLAIFTKQNLGLVSAVLGGLTVTLGTVAIDRRNVKAALTGALAYSIFSIATVAGLFWYFAREIGGAELFRLMFTDAAEAKGGIGHMLAEAFPRLTFGTPQTGGLAWYAHRGAKAIIYAGIVVCSALLYRKRNPARTVSVPELWKLGAIFVALTGAVLLAPVSWLELNDALENFHGINLRYNATVIFFWAIVVGWITQLWKLERRQQILSLYALSVTAAGSFSTFAYVFIGLPFLFALVVAISIDNGLLTVRLRAVAFAVLVAGMNLFYFPTALDARTLSDEPRLKGLLFTKKELSALDFYLRDLRPYVRGKRTLWLMSGGPHSISGSIPVRNVSNLFYDQYAPRIEPILIEAWMSDPPETIVRDRLVPAGTEDRFQGPALLSWIESHYRLATKVRGAEVWLRKQ